MRLCHPRGGRVAPLRARVCCVFVWGCSLCSLLSWFLGLVAVALLFVGVFRRGLPLPRSCGVFGLGVVFGVGLLFWARRPGSAGVSPRRGLVRCPGLLRGRASSAFSRCRRVSGCPRSRRRLSSRCPRLGFVVRVPPRSLVAEGCGASFGASRFWRNTTKKK